MGFKFNPFTGALDSAGASAAPKHALSAATIASDSVTSGNVIIRLKVNNANDKIYTSGDMTLADTSITVAKDAVYRISLSAAGYSGQASGSTQNFQLKLAINGTPHITQYTNNISNSTGQDPGTTIAISCLVELEDGDIITMLSTMTSGFVGGRNITVEEI